MPSIPANPTSARHLDAYRVAIALVAECGQLVPLFARFDDKPELPARMLAYNGLLRHRFFPLPVYSAVVYLMHEPPNAAPFETPRFAGLLRGAVRGPGDQQVEFCYRVIAAWDTPISLEHVQACPVLGPFAALTPAIEKGDLSQLQRVFEEEVKPRKLAGELLALTHLLAGRRFGASLPKSFRRSMLMLDSPTYKEIVEQSENKGIAKGIVLGKVEGRAEGRAEGKIEAVLKFVEQRLGEIPPWLESRLRSMAEEAIDPLIIRLYKTNSVKALRSVLATLFSET